MKPQRLGAIDSAYLAAEEQRAPLHVASVAIFEGEPLIDTQGRLRLDELRARIESRLDLLPRLRQRVAFVPFGIARPVWVDDESFDIADHVSCVGVPPPGDDGALYRLVEDVIMRPLDRTCPLWHLLFVTGLTGGRVALIERAHHAMVDGVSGVDISMVLLDATSEPPPVTPVDWRPAVEPRRSALFVDGVIDRVRAPLSAGLRTARSLTSPRSLGRNLRRLNATIASIRRSGVRAPKSSINRPIGGQRRLSVVRHPFADVHAAARAADATVNDVVLTAVASGVRHLLLARGEPMPPEHSITVLVPVSVRSETESLQLGNRVAAYFTPLPTGIGDAIDRLKEVASRTKALKSSAEAQLADGLLQFADLLPPWVTNLMGREVSHQPFVNIVVTNIPGPPFPLYAMGARMLEAIPIVPLGGNMPLEVAVLSYDGALTICVTSDRTACPDAAQFVDGVERGFRELGVGWEPIVTPLPA